MGGGGVRGRVPAVLPTAAYRAAGANGRDNPRAAVGAIVAKRAPICSASRAWILSSRWVRAVCGRCRTVIAVIVIHNTANAARPIRAVVKAGHLTAVAQRSRPMPRIERDDDGAVWAFSCSRDNFLCRRISFDGVNKQRFRSWRGSGDAVALKHFINDGVDHQLSRKQWHQ